MTAGTRTHAPAELPFLLRLPKRVLPCLERSLQNLVLVLAGRQVPALHPAVVEEHVTGEMIEELLHEELVSYLDATGVGPWLDAAEADLAEQGFDEGAVAEELAISSSISTSRRSSTLSSRRS